MSDRDPSARILAAAEACFARAGFHRATMQEVAREAGMSPGNLYRYFPSKAAIVAGLCERDRAELAVDIASIGDVDLMSAMEAMAMKHLVDAPPHKVAVVVEIWAEATRNPQVRTILNQMEKEFDAMFEALLARGKERGDVAPDVDEGFVTRALCMVFDGLFRRKAVDPAFDGRSDVYILMSLARALVAGEVHAASPEGAVA